jgi:hypothetical protein
MSTKKTKRSQGQRGGNVAGYETWYYQENLNAGRPEILADMKRSYEPDWKPPADIAEKMRPYYRNPEKDTAASKWTRKNATTMLKYSFGKVANVHSERRS